MMLDFTHLPLEQHLDFWLGEWDVSWGDHQHGTNHIHRILDRHVIQENFSGAPGLAFQGLSISVYSPTLGRWRQTWVDSEGSYWAFEGGAENDEFILSTDDQANGQPIKLRMVFYNIERDELDWRWERSDDGGQTWVLKWHIHYRRKVSSFSNRGFSSTPDIPT